MRVVTAARDSAALAADAAHDDPRLRELAWLEHAFEREAGPAAQQAAVPDAQIAQVESALDTLFLQPGNPNISSQDIKTGIQAILAQYPDQPAQAGLEILRGALLHKLSVQQVADAGVFSRQEIETYLTTLGVPTLSGWYDSIAKSLAPHARKTLLAKGLTGAGVGVRVLDPVFDPHAQTVAAVINNGGLGIASGARVEHASVYDGGNYSLDIGSLFWAEVGKTGLPPDHPGALTTGLRNMLAVAAIDSLDDVGAEVKEFTRATGVRVLNMSFGTSMNNYYDIVDTLIEVIPQLSKAFYGSTGPSDQRTYYQKQVDFVNTALLGNPAVIQAYGRYVDTTREAAQHGKTIVVAAGNWQRYSNEKSALGVALPDWGALNIFGLSGDVVAVGASSTQGTPNNLRDDAVANFSSRGSGALPVTLATQGVNVAIPYGLFMHWGGPVSGTSFSAPLVAGTVALMLQQNPHLTFAQIKSLLQTAAVDTPAPAIAEGAGMLDMVDALV